MVVYYFLSNEMLSGMKVPIYSTSSEVENWKNELVWHNFKQILAMEILTWKSF